ncbi:hypothetical protein [Pseudomonas prosekii]|uniref:hypothetical protein n=1 Tax=Pseudomonas prosekii TaxID=1148509 RepID=UPI0011EAAD83|nr:hypothetical protein [Pseudomonas prosekii]
MFETYEAARLPALPSFEQNTTRWAFIAQSANKEWFYVTHQYFQDGDRESVCNQQFMIPDVIGLMSLVRSDTADAFVRSVQLVSPGWMNGTEEWRMEFLLGLIALRGDESGRYAYEVAGGGIYPTQYANAAQSSGKKIWPAR